jgi:hypothetical protein
VVLCGIFIRKFLGSFQANRLKAAFFINENPQFDWGFRKA